MEDHSYVSCIKINGVPILPPMMTKDIKSEMSNYKENAISIEQKLASLRIVKRYNNDICIEKVKKESKDIKYKKKVYTSKENSSTFEHKNDNYNEANITDINDVPIETFENSNEDIEKVSGCGKNLNTRYKSENQVNFAPNTVSRSELITDRIIKSSTIETMSEILKPQVPKTLNIVPLTLSNSSSRENNEYHESDLDNAGDTPKLTRQGSYVLETPSPILLAHMQTELTGGSTCLPCSEYIPTSCTNTKLRKEWNVTRDKIEWEYETRNEESVPIESFTSSTALKENCYSKPDRTMCKSLCLQRKRESSFGTYPSTRSADCIRTMLAKEHIDRSDDIKINRNKKHVTDNSNEKKEKLETWKKRNNRSMFKSKRKLGGSLEDLSERHNHGSTTNNSTEKLSRSIEIQDSVSKLKSSVASDKLITVYKKVQEMHKKQMAELVFRQQREQTLLQKEFEKQQLLLLTEIKKSFPEISVSLLSENILSPAFNNITSNNDNSAQNVRKLKNNLERKNEVEYSRDNVKMVARSLEIHNDSAPCSTKYSYKVRSSETELSSNIDNSALKVEKKDRETESNDANSCEVKLLEENDEWKRSNVSRELFPLDSKTIQVPILDRLIYGEKHITAANMINAYARGYLVRRMMRTERVIALKNTYKEALHCMLKLHVDAPLNRSELNFLHRLQLQCDAASMSIVELFAQTPQKRMQVIAQDREIKQSRIERPTSARSYSFATQRTLARKKLKEMEEYQPTSFVRSCLSRSRCQTWTSDIKDRFISSNILCHSIKRSTSAGTVRKPWR